MKLKGYPLENLMKLKGLNAKGLSLPLKTLMKLSSIYLEIGGGGKAKPFAAKGISHIKYLHDNW